MLVLVVVVVVLVLLVVVLVVVVVGWCGWWLVKQPELANQNADFLATMGSKPGPCSLPCAGQLLPLNPVFLRNHFRGEDLPAKKVAHESADGAAAAAAAGR